MCFLLSQCPFAGTQGSGSSETRDTSNELARFKGYSCLESIWYKKGLEQERKANTNFAYEGLTSTYYSPDSTFILSVAMPYFLTSTDTAPFGVVAADAGTEWMTDNLARLKLQVSDTSHGSHAGHNASMAVVERLGEVVARGDSDNTMTDSSGEFKKINSTSNGDDMAAVNLGLMEKNGNLVEAQGQNDIRGSQLVATSTVANYAWLVQARVGKSNYNAVPNLYAALCNWTFVQVVYLSICVCANQIVVCRSSRDLITIPI